MKINIYPIYSPLHDESFLKEIKRNIYNEIAVSLNKPIEEVEVMIDSKIKFN